MDDDLNNLETTIVEENYTPPESYYKQIQIAIHCESCGYSGRRREFEPIINRHLLKCPKCTNSKEFRGLVN